MSDIAKQAWSLYRNKWGGKLSITVFYVFLIALSLMLGMLSPFSLFLTIPFVVFPFTLSYMASISASNIIGEPSIKALFKLYPLYYKKEFFGGFRAITNLLFSALISIIVSTLSLIVIYYAFWQFQPGFMDAFNQMRDAKTVEKMEEALYVLQNLDCVVLPLKLVSIGSTFVATFAFVRFCLVNSEKFYFNLLNVQPIPMPACNALYKRTKRIRRKDFFREYFKGTWYLHILFILLFGGACVGLYFLGKLNNNQIVFGGLFAAIILMFPFIPYYFEFLSCIYICSAEDYAKASIELSEMSLKRLQHMANVTEEQKKEYERLLQESKDNFERIKKEEEEMQKECEAENKNTSEEDDKKE